MTKDCYIYLDPIYFWSSKPSDPAYHRRCGCGDDIYVWVSGGIYGQVWRNCISTNCYNWRWGHLFCNTRRGWLVIYPHNNCNKRVYPGPLLCSIEKRRLYTIINQNPPRSQGSLIVYKKITPNSVSLAYQGCFNSGHAIRIYFIRGKIQIL